MPGPEAPFNCLSLEDFGFSLVSCPTYNYATRHPHSEGSLGGTRSVVHCVTANEENCVDEKGPHATL